MVSSTPFYLILIGPPGAGKGTQAAMLEQALGLKQVSSGDLFRENLKNETEVGLLAKGYIERGELVPDDVTIRMVRERLARPDCANGAILDGFPRTLEQASALDEMLAAQGSRISLVPLIEVSDEEILDRLTGRRLCRAHGHTYHLRYKPPRVAGICDLDGSELYQRSDDKAGTVRNRLYVYYKQTSPLIGYYFARGLLVRINGQQPIEAVHQELIAAVRAAQ